MAEATLQIIIDAQDRASGTLKGLQTNLKAMEPAFKKMQQVGTVAFAAIAGIGVASMMEFADAQKQMTIANTALTNTLDSFSKDSLGKLGKELGTGADAMKGLQKVMKETGDAALKLGFDDEMASLAFAKLFQVSKDVKQAQEGVKLAMDLTARGIGTLESNTTGLAKIYAGSTRELKQFGIEADATLTPLQAIALLQERVGSSAENAAKTIEGQMRIATEAFNNVRQAIGGALAPAFTQLLTSITPVIQKFQAFAEAHPDLIAKVLLAAGAVAFFVATLGTIGLILPGLITMFAVLATPIGLVFLAITALVGLIVFFHDKIGGLFQLLDEKTGLVTFLKQAWDDVVVVFQQHLMPALSELWTALQPFMPFLGELAKVFGTILVIAIAGAAKVLTGIIILAAELLTAWAKFVTWAAEKLVPIFEFIGDKIAWVSEKIIEMIDWIGKIKIPKAVSSFLSGVGGAAGKVLGINDGIVQNGKIITTHPDDYIIATKDPRSLMGGGGTTILVQVEGAVFSREAARTFADIILGEVRLQMKL